MLNSEGRASSLDWITIGLALDSLRSHEHFKKSLRFVDSVMWFPYSIHRAPFTDLMNVRIDDVVYIPGSLEIIDSKYQLIENSALEERIVYLFITQLSRCPNAEEIMMDIRKRAFNGVFE